MCTADCAGELGKQYASAWDEDGSYSWKTNALSDLGVTIAEGEEVIVRSGETLNIPSNAEHSALALEETLDIDAFSPIRSDWLDGSDSYLRIDANNS